MLSFWRDFQHWLHWKLTKWQPLTKISLKWPYLFRYLENGGEPFPGFPNRPRWLENGGEILPRHLISRAISLTHWGRVTHICVDNLAIIGSDNGLSPGRRQAIIWTNAGILLIGPWGTNFSELLIGIHTFSFKKIHLKMSSVKWRPFCLGLNVLISQRTCPISPTLEQTCAYFFSEWCIVGCGTGALWVCVPGLMTPMYATENKVTIGPLMTWCLFGGKHYLTCCWFVIQNSMIFSRNPVKIQMF